MLGPIDLWAIRDGSWYDREGASYYDCLKGTAFWSDGDHGLSGGPTIDWVIIGGESGPGRRPCEVEWFRSIAEQCRAAGVPVFVKQDSGFKPGMRGRLPDELWSLKEFPASPVSATA
jgi:hypothetical protein